MILLTTINVLIFEMDFMQPSILFNGTMLVSMLFAVLNVNEYRLYIEGYTFCVVTLGMFSFMVGNYYVCFQNKDILYELQKHNTIIKHKYFKIGIISMVMAMLLYFNFKEIYELSISLGNVSGISNVIKTVRYPLEREEVTFSRWFNYNTLIAQMISYVSLYYFFRSFICDKKTNWVYILPSIMYIPFTILTTGRFDLLCLIVYGVVLFSIMYLKREVYSIKSKRKVLIYLLGSACLFILLFLSYGSFTGKVVSATRTPFVILSHYIGLSIPALDIFLQMPVIEDTLIGNYTLSGIYGNLRTLGFDVSKVDVFLPFVKFNVLDTNVYTAFRRYMSDYGVVGMCCILFIFGSLFSIVYEKIKSGNGKMLLILYASYAWSLVMSFHDEKFLMGMLNTSLVYRVVVLYLVIKFFEYNHKIKNSPTIDDGE